MMSTQELIALAIAQNNAAKEYIDDKKHSNNTLLVVLLVLLVVVLVLAWASSARADDNHASLYMDVTVKSVIAVVNISGSPSVDVAYNVEFVNNVGDVFSFTNVTKPFKPGERATIEVEADFMGEIFKVVDMYYTDGTRFMYPDNKEDEWKLHIALIILALTMLFGGYLLGRNNKQYNRKVRR